MKTLTLVFTALFASSAWAAGCPDYSGVYGTTDHGYPVVLFALQTGCANIEVNIDRGYGVVQKRDMILDGVLRQVGKDDYYTTFASYRWDSGEIRMHEESRWQSGSVTSSETRIYQDQVPNWWEETVFFDSHGTQVGTSKVVYGRQ